MNTPKLQYHKRTRRYYGRFQVDGVRRRFWFSANRRKARKELQTTRKEIATGRITFAETETTARRTTDGHKDMRLEELAHKHLAWVQANRGAGTYTVRRYCVQAFLNFMGPAMVSQITRLRLAEFNDWAREHHKRAKNGGNHNLREVRTMLRWAEEFDLCDLPVRRFPPMRNSPARTLRFSDEEIAKLLGRMPAGSFRDMIVFGLLTGLRPQELRGLAKGEVGQDGQGRCYVLIEQHKTSRTAKDPQPRSVPLPQEAAAIVRRQVDSHPDAALVFLTEVGTPYSADVFRRKMERWCRRAKIPARPPYALRHTFASLQADGDVNIVTLGQLMGHSSTRTTARYIRASAEHHKQAVDRTAEHILALLPADAPEAGMEAKSGHKSGHKP